jgi:thiamine pyrophosphokinase
MKRALLVCAVPQPGGVELVARMASEFDIVIGVDAGAATCLRAGVTPTVLVGDFDSLDTDVLDEAVGLGVPVRSYPPDKDRTDIDLAIYEARTMGVTQVCVTAATTERLDHTLGVIAALVGAADLMPYVVEPGLNAWVLSSQGRREVTLRGPGATVSIIAFSPAARVSAVGVRWPLISADISYTATLGISNVVVDDAARVSIEEGVALVLSPVTHVPPACEHVPNLTLEGEPIRPA